MKIEVLQGDDGTYREYVRKADVDAVIEKLFKRRSSPPKWKTLKALRERRIEIANAVREGEPPLVASNRFGVCLFTVRNACLAHGVAWPKNGFSGGPQNAKKAERYLEDPEYRERVLGYTKKWRRSLKAKTPELYFGGIRTASRKCRERRKSRDLTLGLLALGHE